MSSNYRKLIDAPVSRNYKKPMNIEFDPAKNAANIARHGLSLTFGEKVFADVNHIVLPSIRPIDGEDRFKAIGMVDGSLYTAVHGHRETAVRFISVRRSNDGEERIYHRP